MNIVLGKNDSPVLYKSLKSRFYILASLCLFNFLSNMLWNAWSPLLLSMKYLYGWTQTEISLQGNLFSIVFVICIWPFVYVWNKKGIRFVYNLSIMSMVVGTFIRLYPGSINVQSKLIQIGSAITSFGGIMPLIAPTYISMLWFPGQERSRATATAMAFGYLGAVLAPVIANGIVPELSHNQTNIIEKGMKQYMFLHSSIALLAIAVIVAYFPSRPSILPCKSSDISLRLEFWSGCKVLIRNGQFWIVFMVAIVINGIGSALAIVFTSYTIPMGFSQAELGVLSSTANLLTFPSVLVGGWLGVKFSYKSIIYAVIPPSFILYSLTGFQCLDLIPHPLSSLYILMTLECMVSFASPIVYEMGCETAFPVCEEVVTAILALAGNIGIMLFLSVCMIEQLGTAWIPFGYAFSCLLLFPLMLFYKDERNRLKCDENDSVGDSNDGDENYNEESLTERTTLLT